MVDRPNPSPERRSSAVEEPSFVRVSSIASCTDFKSFATCCLCRLRVTLALEKRIH
jgi:hypothetical protein